MVKDRDIKSHREQISSTRPENGVSWFQPYPRTSVEFLDLFELPSEANIIDIGAGDSHFVDVLIARGYKNLHMLDISENALKRARQRVGDSANQVNWIVSDIIDFNCDTRFDFWHDRAAFHFPKKNNGLPEIRLKHPINFFKIKKEPGINVPAPLCC